jgi:hypothetical protein
VAATGRRRSRAAAPRHCDAVRQLFQPASWHPLKTGTPAAIGARRGSETVAEARAGWLRGRNKEREENPSPTSATMTGRYTSSVTLSRIYS